MQPLKLVALDEEDLGVIAAHLQDAVMRLDGIVFLPEEKRFALVLNRFDWVQFLAGGKSDAGANVRRRTALRFEHVSAVQQQHIAQQAAGTVLSLLTIAFQPTEAPAGQITLIFAGGAAIRLMVDCIEAELRDLGGAWSAANRPDHDADGSGST